MICSNEPLLSKSLTYNLHGPFLPAHNFVLCPQFPARMSGYPSPFTSAVYSDCHNPVDCGISISVNVPLLLMKTFTDIHSPATTRSGHPSLLTSVKEAAVTMPNFSRFIILLLATSNFPLPSFRYR